MKRLVVIALTMLLVGLIGGWTTAEVVQQRQTVPVDPPVIVSGNDIGFRIEGRRGDVRVGSIVVKVNGRWVATALSEGWHQATAQDKAGIERLHQQDLAATFSDKLDELANLWDNDAVRIQPGRPAEVGKAAIYADDKRWEASKGQHKLLCGHMDIQDVQMAGDWAFEWGYFSMKENTADGNVSTGQGKVLRVLHRQADGSWKFARVMNVTDELASAAPVPHPCE